MTIPTAQALAVTAGTLALSAVLGGWYSRGKISSAEAFVTARNTTSHGATTATLVASSMGAWILFSPAEAGAAFGGITAVAGYALGSAVPMVVFVRLGPRIRRLIPDGHTLTEYAYARYGSAMYAYVLLVSVSYMFVFLAAEMTGIAGALSFLAAVPEWQTAGLVGFGVLVYAGYGGLRASIFTDTIQTLLVLPLLAVCFGGAVLSLGGTSVLYETITATNPTLLDPGFLPGLQFGAYIVIAVLGAEMLNQTWWQRIYAARDEATVRRSFGVAAVAVLPMLTLAGVFGIAASGMNLVVADSTAPGYNADVALFVLVANALPDWVALVVVLLAVLLVASTVDTLFNALSSVVTADLPLLLDDPEERTLTRTARLSTVLVALAATIIGAQGYSVLQLFLTADLLAAATFVPLLAGLYSPGLTERGALAASLSGLTLGAAFMPTLRGLLRLPFLPKPSFLAAFGIAALVSTGMALCAAELSDESYDLRDLSTRIRRLDERVSDGGERL